MSPDEVERSHHAEGHDGMQRMRRGLLNGCVMLNGCTCIVDRLSRMVGLSTHVG
jgi:hypothetical protein